VTQPQERPTFAALLDGHIREQMEIPADFDHARKALRELREKAIHDVQFWEMSDALDMLERYVYDRATPEEIHKAANR